MKNFTCKTLISLISMIIPLVTVNTIGNASVVWPLRVYGVPYSGGLTAESQYRFDDDCPTGRFFSTRNPKLAPEPLASLNIPQTHQLTVGDNTMIALIDTGVPDSVNGRVNVIQGGDLLGGYPVCSLHGEITAGVMGGASRVFDGFVGVAPQTRIVSYRVYDSTARAQIYGARPEEEMLRVIQRNIEKAIVAAVNRGIRIIVVGGSVCIDNPRELDGSFLPTLHWANAKGVIVIAASGGVNQIGHCSNGVSVDMNNIQPIQGSTRYTPVRFPSVPLPAASSDVISVTGTTNTGGLSADSLPGPWVSLTAPISNTVSLHFYPGLNRIGLLSVTTVDDKTFIPIGDAGVAAGDVAGVIALLWSYKPWLTADQIKATVFRTALTPGVRVNTSVGYGVINPYAALTYSVPLTGITDRVSDFMVIPKQPPKPGRNYHPLFTALTIAGSMLGVLIIVGYVMVLIRQRKHSKQVVRRK